MTKNDSHSPWPVPVFYFLVDWGDMKQMAFQEVSGLDTGPVPMEYRHSTPKVFSTVQLPGVKDNSRVTLKNGRMVKDQAFWKWHQQTLENSIVRQTVVIQLVEETGAPLMIWTLTNAWPAKVVFTNQDTESKEVTVDSIEIAHEGITMANS